MRTLCFLIRPNPLTAAVALSVGALVMAGCPGPGPSADPWVSTSTMCVRQATGVPYQPGPPTVDGTVLEDLGWTRAFRFTLGNTGSNKTGAIQAIHSSGTVYFSFEVDDDVTLDAFDRIILALDPDNAAGNSHMIQIQPFAGPTTGSGTDVATANTLYWTGEPGSWTSASPPSSLQSRVTYAAAGSVATWSVEVAVAAADLAVPSTANFGLYLNTIVVDATFTGPDPGQQYTWPAETLLTGSGALTPESGIPALSEWGTATRSSTATCYGVYFATGDIASDPLPEWELSLSVPNTFRVDVYNTSMDDTGFIPAGNVRATFRIADFGLGEDWDMIPVADNPTPAATIPAATGATSPGTDVLSTQGWSAPSEYSTHTHQCILVELDSEDENVSFINRSTWRNMNFQTTSSPFQAEAVIHTAGYELPEGEQEHTFLLTADAYNTPRDSRWTWEIDGAEQVGERTYRVTLAPGETGRLGMVITPPTVPIPGRRFTIPPGTGRGGQGVSLPVEPGQLLTFITRGRLNLRSQGGEPGGPQAERQEQGLMAGPNGVDLRDRDIGPEQLPLEARHSPAARVGAVVGRWEGVEEGSTFVIGSGRSVKVPGGARSLSVVINDVEEGFGQQGGEGFVVQVVQTPVRPEFARTNSLVGRDPDHEFVPLPLGINVPSWRVCGKRKTGRQLQIGEQVIDVYEDAGCFGYMVHQMGR